MVIRIINLYTMNYYSNEYNIAGKCPAAGRIFYLNYFCIILALIMCLSLINQRSVILNFVGAWVKNHDPPQNSAVIVHKVTRCPLSLHQAGPLPHIVVGVAVKNDPKREAVNRNIVIIIF